MVSPTAAVVAAAPDSSGVVQVTIPSLDGGARRLSTIGYPRPAGGALPARGDKALVVEDNTGQLWLIAWEASA